MLHLFLKKTFSLAGAVCVNIAIIVKVVTDNHNNITSVEKNTCNFFSVNSQVKTFYKC